MEHSTYSMGNQMKTGTKKLIEKEEDNDHSSTVDNAGDRRKPLEKVKKSNDSMFCRSVKVEISPADVENTECGQLANPVKQEPSQPASSDNVKKKEELSDNLSTVVLPETSVSTSPCQQPSAENSRKRKILGPGTSQCFKNSKCMDGAPSDLCVSLATTTDPDVPPNTFISTSLLKAENKPNRPATIESSPVQVKNIGSTVRIEPTGTTTTSADDGTYGRSILESGAGDSNDECSIEDADFNDTGLPKQRQVEDNTNQANEKCNGGQFTCLDCVAVFETDATLKLHVASHKGYRRYKCTVCEKQFTGRATLKEHMNIHTGERPFECLICQKRFSANGSLHRHKVIHTRERSFKCDVCTKCFTQSGSLATHKRSHTGVKPFECDICDKKFTANGELTKHRRIHTGEKPFKCDVCKKCVTQSGSLTKHKLIHTGEKPYHCLSCGLRFRHKCSLKIHTRRQHSDADAGSQLAAPQNGVDQSSSIDACDSLGNSINGQKILYKRKLIGYLVEKMTRNNPDVVFLVWSKKFAMELASAVVRSGYNCILCVKKIQPQPFRDVMTLSNGLHTCLVEVGPDSKTLRLFSFGGMILPDNITDHGRFKSLAKLEWKMRRFSQSEGRKMVNIFKLLKKNSGWYRALRNGLKAASIITDKI